MEMAPFKKILDSLGITPQQVAQVLRTMPPGFQANFKFFAIAPMSYVPALTEIAGGARLSDTGYQVVLFQDTAARPKENLVLLGSAGQYPVVEIEEFLNQVTA